MECGDKSSLGLLAKPKSGDKSKHSKSCRRLILMRFNLEAGFRPYLSTQRRPALAS
ncbi:MAG: hypothetical protein V7641_5684, partial [Blastocatellia bacterium]